MRFLLVLLLLLLFENSNHNGSKQQPHHHQWGFFLDTANHACESCPFSFAYRRLCLSQVATTIHVSVHLLQNQINQTKPNQG